MENNSVFTVWVQYPGCKNDQTKIMCNSITTSYTSPFVFSRLLFAIFLCKTFCSLRLKFLLVGEEDVEDSWTRRTNFSLFKLASDLLSFPLLAEPLEKFKLLWKERKICQLRKYVLIRTYCLCLYPNWTKNRMVSAETATMMTIRHCFISVCLVSMTCIYLYQMSQCIMGWFSNFPGKTTGSPIGISMGDYSIFKLSVAQGTFGFVWKLFFKYSCVLLDSWWWHIQIWLHQLLHFFRNYHQALFFFVF